jgi:hypothetical protein
MLAAKAPHAAVAVDDQRESRTGAEAANLERSVLPSKYTMTAPRILRRDRTTSVNSVANSEA